MYIKSILLPQQHNNRWIIQDYAMTDNKILTNTGSQIFEGTNVKTKKSVAIKCMPCKDVNMEELKKIINATPIQFPFILNLQDAFFCKSSETLYLIFDKCAGFIDNYLIKINTSLSSGPTNKIFPECKALEIFLQIVEGCFWLWGNDIIHRSIDPKCILYKFDEYLQQNAFIISDFGASTFKSSPFIEDGNVSPYKAPESVASNTYDYLSNVWSLGLILHELLFGEVYYNGSSAECIKNRIINTSYKLKAVQKEMISAKTATLLECMIAHDPKKRLTKEGLQKMMREYAEYEFVRKILFKFEHKKIFLQSDLSSRDINLQYAKRLINNSWEMALNDYDTISKAMTEEAFKIYLAILGEDYAETRYAMIRYAQDLMFLDQIEEAAIVGGRALELYEKNKNEHDPNLAKAYMIIGDIYSYLEDYQTSKIFLEKAVKMRFNVNGEYHRDTASAINNLGATLRDLNDLIGAKKHHKKSLNIKIKLFGRQHFEASYSYFNLSLVFFDMKDYKKALSFCKKAKSSREKYFGKNHDRTKEVEKQEKIIIRAMKKKY